MSLILLSPVDQPFTARDLAGRVLPRATLDFFVAGTSQPADVGDDDGHFEADDSGAFPVIELAAATSYRVVHKDADGRLIYDVDPYVCTCGNASPIFRSPIQRAFDGAGNIAPGAKLYSFASDGETPAPLYADPNLTTPLPNPIVANAAGVFRLPIYGDDDVTYVLELRDAAGGVLEKWEPYQCVCGIGPLGEFEVTVGNIDGSAFGYENGLVGSIAPDPPSFEAVTIRTISQLTSGIPDFRVRFVGSAPMPSAVNKIVVETVSGDVELAVADAVVVGTNDYRWFASLWSSGDIGDVRTVRFLA